MKGFRTIVVLAVAAVVSSGVAVFGVAVGQENGTVPASLVESDFSLDKNVNEIDQPVEPTETVEQPGIVANPAESNLLPSEYEELPEVMKGHPKISVEGYDGNGNGLYDYLVVEAEYNLPGMAVYELQGALFSEDDYCFISTESVVAVLDGGKQTLSLRFFGYLILQSGIDGPYLLHLFLTNRETSETESTDYYTKAFSHEDFEAYSDYFPPKEMWIDSISVELTGDMLQNEGQAIEGVVVLTIMRSPGEFPIASGDVYALIVGPGNRIPDDIVWDGGAGFTMMEDEYSITIELEFRLMEHGSYTAAAYLTSIENPEVVSCEFQA